MDPNPADHLDELLQGGFSPTPDSPLRRALLEKTIRQLRRGRIMRRCLLAGGWAACFVAGGLAVFLWQTVVAPQERGEQPQRLVEQPLDKTPPPTQKSAPPKENVKPSPLAKEWEAFDSTDNRAALFFEAGNRYFTEDNDVQGALRCYRQALDASSPEQLAVSPSDNWLLISLKQSRQ